MDFNTFAVAFLLIELPVSYNDVANSVANHGMLVASSAMLLFILALVFVFIISLLKKSIDFMYKQIHDEFSVISESDKKFHAALLEITNCLRDLKDLSASSPKNLNIPEPFVVVAKDKKIASLLRDFRHSYAAARVDLFFFTNGVTSYCHNTSYMRFIRAFSSMSELCRFSYLKEAQISLLASFFDQLFRDREIHIDGSSPDVGFFGDGIVKEWLVSACPCGSLGLLKDGDRYIGFVSATYDDFPMSNRYASDFRNFCTKLSVVLACE